MDENKQDDLTKVKGIGPKTAEAMNAVGINSFADLAKGMSAEVRANVNNAVNAPGGLDYDGFIEQAIALSGAGDPAVPAVDTPADAAAEKEASEKAASEKAAAEKGAADTEMKPHETLVGSDDLPAMAAIPQGGEEARLKAPAHWPWRR